MALYQATTQQQLQQLQQQQNSLYMNNQSNVNWNNLIQYPQLLYAQQLYNNVNNFQTPFIVTMPVIQSIPMNTNIIPNKTTAPNQTLSLNPSIVNGNNAKESLVSPLTSPLNIDSMSPQTISSLLNAPEFIPTPKAKSEQYYGTNNDEYKGKLNAHCNDFIPGVTQWKSNTLDVIKEDDSDCDYA